MLPDVNTIIRRDQARRFGEGDLKTMRGSSRNFMMYGESCKGVSFFGVEETKLIKMGIRGPVLGTLEFL